MRTLLTIVALLIGTSLTAQFDLGIKITGLKSKGKLLMAVYDSQEHFLKKVGMVRHVARPVEGKEMEFTLEDMPAGKYAIAFMIDTNGNEEMDYYFFGLPKEKYGFYTDPGIIFSAPEFAEVSFQLEKDEQIVMKAK